ncbi:putative oxoglutarate/iron-dependent dioxygenase, non-heme dioxygenase domain-containing protein [Helianthus annuus]|nr:putative oxoglutarate/iron-dependent dioxygenase, non-heme dioxygenase domain-containing protein [Helianthus annuus]
MGSDAYIQLPVIDFSVLDSQNPDLGVYDSIKTQVLEALQEYGCFHASIGGVSPDLQNSVYSAIENLFNLPTETKSKNTSTKMFYGYIGNSPQLPLYESMGIDDPYIPEQVQKFTNLMWPQGNPQVSNDIHMYVKKLWELNVMTKKMVFEILNLEMYLHEHIELTNYVLKLMKYRVPEPNESNLGLHTHADAGVMTILHQNDVEGLEILTKDDEWLKVKLSPNLFIVMAGETLNVSNMW